LRNLVLFFLVRIINDDLDEDAGIVVTNSIFLGGVVVVTIVVAIVIFLMNACEYILFLTKF